MKLFTKGMAVLSCTLILTGCLSPQYFESDPVKLTTPKGVVICQLYKQNQVIWDRAIDRPESMSVAEADAYCIAEGQRRLEA